MPETIEELKKRINHYEQCGAAKLFYALNRKASEMADLLNKTVLSNLSLDDRNDKTFERLKVIWSDSASLSAALETLSRTAGITNDEEKDTQSPKHRITPESIANVLGHTAGQRS